MVFLHCSLSYWWLSLWLRLQSALKHPLSQLFDWLPLKSSFIFLQVQEAAIHVFARVEHQLKMPSLKTETWHCECVCRCDRKCTWSLLSLWTEHQRYAPSATSNPAVADTAGRQVAPPPYQSGRIEAGVNTPGSLWLKHTRTLTVWSWLDSPSCNNLDYMSFIIISLGHRWMISSSCVSHLCLILLFCRDQAWRSWRYGSSILSH